MPERFIKTAEVAEILGISPRIVYTKMASGEIQSWCVNPTSQRKKYYTTMTALEKWQSLMMLKDNVRERVQDWHIQRK